MRYRVTSVTGEDEGKRLNPVLIRLQDELNSKLADANYGVGVDQFCIVLVSVFDEAKQNEPFLAKHRRLGKYKDLITKAPVRYLSIAVPILPSTIASTTPDGQIRRLVIAGITEQLAHRPKRIPRGFDFEGLASSVREIVRV